MTVNNRYNPSSAIIPSPCLNDRLTAKSRFGAQRQWCQQEEDDATVPTTTASFSSPVQLFLDSLLISSSVNLPPAILIEQQPCDGLKRQHSVESDCDDSVTSSSSSSSTSRRPSSKKRQKHGIRVTFAEQLITSVYTRPKTSKEEKSLLHYSFDEMDLFREEYYRERRREAQLVDSQQVNWIADDSSSSSDLEEEDQVKQPFVRKHPVSKVVILHKENDGGQVLAQEDIPPCFRAVYTANDGDDYSFDNPAFWTGNLTWY
mmetsp:Transcript_332/g.494  ORF Transcript_332/g.494 Transcript_332/m.494 type:complete len:260 (-) Transcript_332:236-1015(-)